MMNKEELKIIQTELFEKYNLNIDDTDPIWVVLAANTALFTEYLDKMEQVLIIHKSELESFKERFILELVKEQAKANKSVEKGIESLKTYENERKRELEESYKNMLEELRVTKKGEYKLNRQTILLFFGVQLITLMVGAAMALIL